MFSTLKARDDQMISNEKGEKKINNNWVFSVCLDYPEFRVVFCLFVYEL